MAPEVLGPRALNRATLARQMLLERHEVAPVDAVGLLVGLQAQEPPDPHVALHARLAGFDPAVLSRAMEDREVVRIVAMRATVHMLTAADAATLRPLTQRVLDDELRRHPEHRWTSERDMTPVLDAARPFLSDPAAPRSMKALRQHLGERFPADEAAGMAYACRNLLPLVQTPPRGMWGRSAQVAYVTLQAWTGRDLDPDPSIDDVALRYIAAFGPARPADLATWSRLTGFREVLDRLRPRLRAFRDERGRELLDLPDAPRPDEDVPAAPRFLPQYDNVLLSHGDRSRFHGDRHAELVAGVGESWGRCGSVLLDGTVLGPWHVERDEDGGATVVVRHARRVTARAAGPLRTEARRLLRLLAPEAGSRELRLEPVAP
ncbi:MAG: winged helix DNA-binding domain-containing protein [Thermoleophilia bacterium]